VKFTVCSDLVNVTFLDVMWCFDMHYMYFRLVIHCKSYNQKSLNFVTKKSGFGGLDKNLGFCCLSVVITALDTQIL